MEDKKQSEEEIKKKIYVNARKALKIIKQNKEKKANEDKGEER